jgi:hypothetical protein
MDRAILRGEQIHIEPEHPRPVVPTHAVTSRSSRYSSLPVFAEEVDVRQPGRVCALRRAGVKPSVSSFGATFRRRSDLDQCRLIRVRPVRPKTLRAIVILAARFGFWLFFGFKNRFWFYFPTHGP